MSKNDLIILLTKLIETWENEVVEFKQASNDYSTTDIGRYFSAMANEANLKGAERAWLVFGVDNKSRSVVGTGYRQDSSNLQGLKMQITDGTGPRTTFRAIHEMQVDGKRVVMFEIPASPLGIPIAWQGHYYARAGESLTALGIAKQDEIRQQTINLDWSAEVVANASLLDLDEMAVAKAKQAFVAKHALRLPTEAIEQWSDETFLDRAKLTRDGCITRTALLLLGKAESAHRLSPNPAQISWRLEGPERAYEHFGPPFLLSTSHVYHRIRNFQLRLLPRDQLIPFEVAKYDQKIILEALHNCIAHQDYTLNGRIIVTEQVDKLIFENVGSFFEGLPDDYISGNKTPKCYRNPFLAQAMVALNMIDTMGYGIHDMHDRQAKRYLPMPDYHLEENQVVKIVVYGGVVDPAYSSMLAQKVDLPLSDVLALDRVQKKLPIDDEIARQLKKAKLIEGRKPNYFLSAIIVKATGGKAAYIRTRGQDDAFYRQLIVDYLEKFGQATRKEINDLLIPKLSEAINSDQKDTKISNLLTKMRRSGRIDNRGSRANPIWHLADTMQKGND